MLKDGKPLVMGDVQMDDVIAVIMTLFELHPNAALEFGEMIVSFTNKAKKFGTSVGSVESFFDIGG